MSKEEIENKLSRLRQDLIGYQSAFQMCDYDNEMEHVQGLIDKTNEEIESLRKCLNQYLTPLL